MEKLNANLNISNDSLKEYQKELYAKILNDDDFPLLVKEGYSNQEIFDNVSNAHGKRMLRYGSAESGFDQVRQDDSQLRHIL